MAIPPPAFQTDDAYNNVRDVEQRRVGNPYGSASNFNALKNDEGFQNNMLARVFQKHVNTSGHSFGNGSWGNDFSANVLQDPAYAAQFRIRPGETKDSWLQRLEMTFPGISKSAQASGVFDDPQVANFFGYESYRDPTTGMSSAQQEEAGRLKSEQSTRDEIASFSDSLRGDLDPNDPEVSHILKTVGGNSLNQARLRGIEGPASIAAMEGNTAGALFNYNQGRKDRYGQALQFKSQDQLAQGQRLNAAAMQNWQRDAGMAQQRAANDPLPTALGIGAGAVGGVAGFFAGGPAGAAAGASGGFNLGRGIGQAFTQPNIPPPPSRYGGY
jgi:hypothetical protein